MNANAISVSAQTHELLKLMARHEKRPIAELVEAAVERYRRDILFEVADAAYRSASRKKDLALAAWGNALADGLSPR
jgi:hypothetical protein